MKDSTNASPSRTDSLRALQQEVQNTLLLTEKFLQGTYQTSSNSNRTHPIPSLDLPLPEDIGHAFNGLVLSPQALININQKYRHSLHQLQQLHRQKYEEACTNLCKVPQASNALPLPLFMERLRKVYESTYAHRLSAMKDEVIALCAKFVSNSEPKKVPFNAEFTPLLEKYFERNAYPSAPDRQVLAQKTTMTPRQIEVWFQNHRKRAKENGRTINRMQPNNSHNFSVSSEKQAFSTSATAKLDDQPELIITSNQEYIPGNGEINSFTNEIAVASYASDHATKSRIFPSPFSPSTAIYHFQSDTTFTFPHPTWPRTPSYQSTTRSNINMDTFISTFAAKLNIRDGASKSKRKSSFRSQTQTPWFFATTTIAPCAPHPAFILTSRPPTSPKQATKAPFSDTSFALGSPQPLQTTLSPTVTKQSRLPKAAPFPKRYPSKYHPYSHISALAPHRSSRAHDVSATSFGSRASSLASMPSRTSSAKVTETALPAVSWVSTLEFTSPPAMGVVTLEATSPSVSRVSSVDSLPSSRSMVTSVESAASSGSRITSFDSSSSFGSRTSSLSSINSPQPTYSSSVICRTSTN
ncbi:hypothetical protein HYPSUDRAFT_388785 [Hypholoma sublateritium FD-334 SS-4]|uniref:Homeobox domain-containing protein n=1 Tax=Hypholoma sublateritium (strain FD-334 SS-4) TaxID=945553 RepID=A0A0D2P4P0_HYPSF|nr:hypothetical protein HYPSUDRAFT_388785 [Hypholoma sublateritium FD-334 SS-4]